MTSNLSYLPLILSGVFLNAFAQLALKQGALRISSLPFSIENLVPIAHQIIFSPWIIAGLFAYGLSVVLWILALSRVDVSFAYPLLSIGYVIVAIFGWAVFNETLTPSKIIGIAVIILGVILISKP